MPLPCQTKFINCIKVFWQDYVCARSYEETLRGILLYQVYKLSVTRSERSNNMAAWPRSANVTEISSTEEQAADESWNEDEPLDENIPLPDYGHGREQDEEASESEISKSLYSGQRRKLEWNQVGKTTTLQTLQTQPKISLSFITNRTRRLEDMSFNSCKWLRHHSNQPNLFSLLLKKVPALWLHVCSIPACLWI